MSTGLKANADGSAAIQVGGSDAITITSGLDATNQGASLSIGARGYATGAGGTVTQLTSRATTVAINKLTGSITLFSAAGSSAYTGFTVSNSTVSATDIIIVGIRLGMTNIYNLIVTNIQNGGFSIFVSAVSGTIVEAPVINFAVIKGVTS